MPLFAVPRMLALPIFGLAMLLSACGGGGAPDVQTAPIAFPNALNLPTVNIVSRVVNLNSKSGYQYAKVSLAIKFADPKGEFTKAKGDALAKLQTAFVADQASKIDAFNDVITADLSQKTPDELLSPQGKETLRKQLIQDFNARIAEPPQVVWIEFTDFVMQ